jgi:hypothetical protein
MEAGHGAQRQVEHWEAAVEEARHKLRRAEQQLHAWRQGLEGERQTGRVLAELQAAGWVILHDLHWPGRPYANIDHIAIGPNGIYVIDSKNWSGNVEVRGGVLRQNGYARTSECAGVASAAAAVAAFLEPQHRSLISAVLCLVGRPTPLSQPRDIRVLGSADLGGQLGQGRVRLSPADVSTVSSFLRGLLGGPQSPALTTTAALATAGVAPREPTPLRQPAAVRPVARRRSTRRPPARASASRDALVKLVAVAVVALALLVLLPAVLHSMASSMAQMRPSPTVPTAAPGTVLPHPTVSKRTSAHPSSTAHN